MLNIALPTILTLVVTALFLIAERVFPGRELPNSKGWYFRVLLINLFQLGIVVVTNELWYSWLGVVSLFQFDKLNAPVLEGFIGWLHSTFFFYLLPLLHLDN